MATIQDIARKAGVSISTVSYALSGTRSISEDTKARIRQAMDEVGYSPNALAQGLASKRSRIIALLMNPVDRQVGSTEMEFVSAAAQTAHNLGYHLILWADPLTTPAELEVLGSRGLVEAVLLMEVSLKDWRVDVLSRLGIPCAMIGRPSYPGGLNWVDIDFDRTMVEVSAWLRNAGHREIILINQSRQSYDSGYGPVVRIQESFIRQCTCHGLTGYPTFCQADAQSGHDAIQYSLGKHPRASAVLVMNDHALPGILHGCQELGRKIPHDISLVALLSSPHMANNFWPPLSTMDIPAGELGSLGITRLIEQLESDGATAIAAPMLLPCLWSVRGTTGPGPFHNQI